MVTSKTFIYYDIEKDRILDHVDVLKIALARALIYDFLEFIDNRFIELGEL